MSDLVPARRLDDLEAAMLAEQQVECPVEHIFRRGVYIRKALFPAGSVVLGHAWKRSHWNVLLSGHVRAMIGGKTEEMVAPRYVKAPPGRKLFFAITDVIWANVIETDLTDLAAIEAELVEPSEAWKQKELA